MRELAGSDAADSGKNRWAAWLIVSVISLPILAAWVIYTTGFGIPRGTINKGELLQPATSLASLELRDENGTSFSLPGEHMVWRMLLVGDSVCDKACADLLYVSRQLHVRLGDKAHRVERLYLNTDSDYTPALRDRLTREYPHLILAHVSGDEWKHLFQATNAANHDLRAQHLYIVDQQGFAMMSYDATHAGGDILADIKRLLKYSYEAE